MLRNSEAELASFYKTSFTKQEKLKKFPVESFFNFKKETVNKRASDSAVSECYSYFDRSGVSEFL